MSVWDICGIILTGYSEKYLYQLTGMEAGEVGCTPPELWYGTDMGSWGLNLILCGSTNILCGSTDIF